MGNVQFVVDLQLLLFSLFEFLLAVTKNMIDTARVSNLNLDSLDLH